MSPSCDGSNCSACACNASLERECRNLREENEDLRARLRRLEANLEREVQARVSQRMPSIQQEAERSAREKIKSEIRPEVEAEVRQTIETEIRPKVEREVKTQIVEGLIGKL